MHRNLIDLNRVLWCQMTFSFIIYVLNLISEMLYGRLAGCISVVDMIIILSHQSVQK